MDAGTGETGHGLGGLVQSTDDAGAALAGTGELDGSADLGLHGTLAELALVGQGPIGLVGFLNAGSSGSHSIWVTTVAACQRL